MLKKGTDIDARGSTVLSLISITERYIDSYDQCFCHTGPFSHLCLLSAEDWWEKMKRNTTVPILNSV